MSSGLGFRQATGKLTTANGDPNPYGTGMWTVQFTPAIFAVSTGDFEIYHIALTGPLGSQVQVWMDRNFYDISNHGDLNSWDSNQAMLLNGGQTVAFYWNSGIAPTPLVTVWVRQSGVLLA